MCLIVAAPNGQLTPEKHIRNAYVAGNSDGWGISYWTGTKVLVRKGFDLAGLVAASRIVEGKPYVLHLRWATSGNKTLNNCHPFKIRKDLYMAHNGVLPFQPEKGDTKSDTALLADILRRFSPEHIIDNLDNLGLMIGMGNKLAFQFRDQIHIANEYLGYWNEGLWYSNDYYHVDEWALWTDNYVYDFDSEWEKWLFEEEEKTHGYRRNKSFICSR